MNDHLPATDEAGPRLSSLLKEGIKYMRVKEFATLKPKYPLNCFLKVSFKTITTEHYPFYWSFVFCLK